MGENSQTGIISRAANPDELVKAFKDLLRIQIDGTYLFCRWFKSVEWIWFKLLKLWPNLSWSTLADDRRAFRQQFHVKSGTCALSYERTVAMRGLHDNQRFAPNRHSSPSPLASASSRLG